MPQVAAIVRDAHRGETLHITDPDIGEVTVLVPEPRKSRRLESGVEHVVFTHPSGRMIGLNWAPPDGDPGWARCSLVADAGGYHHALLLRESGTVRLLTRREPGRPEDWEDRGVVTTIDRPGDHEA